MENCSALFIFGSLGCLDHDKRSVLFTDILYIDYLSKATRFLMLVLLPIVLYQNIDLYE